MRLAILTPKYSDYAPQTRWSIRALKDAYDWAVIPMSVSATYIHVARAMLLDAAVAMHTTGEQPLDYILWLDSDIAFSPEDVQHLHHFLGSSEPMCVSGLYYCRHTVNFPSAWMGSWDGGINYMCNWQKDRHYRVNYMGMGFMLMPIEVAALYVKMRAFEYMFCSDNWLPSYNGDGICQAGEDIYFSENLRELGVTLWLDTHVRLWHNGITHESVQLARKTGTVQPYSQVVIEEI